MKVSVIISELKQIEPIRRMEFLQDLLEKALSHQINGKKVKETALNCYMEDMYTALLMQDYNKTLDEFCEEYSLDELIVYLTEIEDKVKLKSIKGNW